MNRSSVASDSVDFIRTPSAVPPSQQANGKSVAQTPGDACVSCHGWWTWTWSWLWSYDAPGPFFAVVKFYSSSSNFPPSILASVRICHYGPVIRWSYPWKTSDAKAQRQASAQGQFIGRNWGNTRVLAFHITHGRRSEFDRGHELSRFEHVLVIMIKVRLDTASNGGVKRVLQGGRGGPLFFLLLLSLQQTTSQMSNFCFCPKLLGFGGLCCFWSSAERHCEAHWDVGFWEDLEPQSRLYFDPLARFPHNYCPRNVNACRG